jgi:acyl-CoA thioesterase-1
MNEWVFLPLRDGRRLAQVAALACLVACGSGGNVDNAGNSRETKDNMSVTKGTGSTATASSTGTGLTVGRNTGSAGTPVVLFFGTSLTAGLGLDPEQAYPSLIEKKAQAEGVPIKVINAGLSGETTAGALRRIDWVLRSPADLIVIEGGANDALRGLPPDDARANLEQLIAAVRAKQPQVKIALVQMEAPPNFGAAYTRSFHAIYPEVAKKENVSLLPFLLDGVAGIPRLNQPDGVHPNLTGERIVADNVWKGVKPLIAQLDRGSKGG